MPNALAAAICRTTADSDVLMPGMAILSLAVKSFSDLTPGLMVLSQSDEVLSAPRPMTSERGMPCALDHRVSIRRAGADWELTVEDDGPGIAEAHWERVRKPFSARSGQRHG